LKPLQRSGSTRCQVNQLTPKYVNKIKQKENNQQNLHAKLEAVNNEAATD